MALDGLGGRFLLAGYKKICKKFEYMMEELMIMIN